MMMACDMMSCDDWMALFPPCSLGMWWCGEDGLVRYTLHIYDGTYWRDDINEWNTSSYSHISLSYGYHTRVVPATLRLFAFTCFESTCCWHVNSTIS
jgi:hypothetical protein